MRVVVRAAERREKGAKRTREAQRTSAVTTDVLDNSVDLVLAADSRTLIS